MGGSMKGAHGYGRYNDDPTHVGCPRAKSDMTPCIARDGGLASADGSTAECVGCGAKPSELLKEFGETGHGVPAADKLKELVWSATENLAAQ
jgi:hypothetical protein